MKMAGSPSCNALLPHKKVRALALRYLLAALDGRLRAYEICSNALALGYSRALALSPHFPSAPATSNPTAIPSNPPTKTSLTE